MPASNKDFKVALSLLPSFLPSFPPSSSNPNSFKEKKAQAWKEKACANLCNSDKVQDKG
jgi:hypothetical protein